MARCIDQALFDAAIKELQEQLRVRNDVKRTFGWKPEVVRILRRGVCLVTVRGSFSCAVEFLFAEGLLVGVPPKKRLGS